MIDMTKKTLDTIPEDQLLARLVSALPETWSELESIQPYSIFLDGVAISVHREPKQNNDIMLQGYIPFVDHYKNEEPLGDYTVVEKYVSKSQNVEALIEALGSVFAEIKGKAAYDACTTYGERFKNFHPELNYKSA